MKSVLVVIITLTGLWYSRGNAQRHRYSCGSEMMNECQEKLQGVATAAIRIHSTRQQPSEEEVIQLCEATEDALRCVDEYANLCQSEDVMVQGANMLQGARDLLKTQCLKDNLDVTRCMAGVQKEVVNRCFSKFQTMFKDVTGEEQFRPDGIGPENLKLACCGLDFVFACSRSIALSKCGEKSVEVFDQQMRVGIPNMQVISKCERMGSPQYNSADCLKSYPEDFASYVKNFADQESFSTMSTTEEDTISQGSTPRANVIDSHGISSKGGDTSKTGKGNAGDGAFGLVGNMAVIAHLLLLSIAAQIHV